MLDYYNELYTFCAKFQIPLSLPEWLRGNFFLPNAQE